MWRGKPTLIVPVEIQVREWDAKLLLACLAAERGFRTVIGCHARLNQRLHRLPPGLYLAKGVTRLTLRMLRIARQLGHLILAWDEEALVYMLPEHYLRRKVFEPTLATTDVLFAWGADNAELWRRRPATRERPIHVTGNPRGDLLRPELRSFYDASVHELRERHGELILLSSNFGTVNHFFPEITRLRRPSAETLRAPLAEDLVGTDVDPRMARYRHQLFEDFKAMIPRIAAEFPDHTVVVRPHPSGNHDTWRRAAGNAPNVVVTTEGNVHPWLLAAGAMLHNGCTTAVEAFCLERPAVAYRPRRHEIYDIPLPNSLSRTATTSEELIDTLGSALDSGFEAGAEQRATVRRHIAALDGPLASERILDHLEALVGAEMPEDRRPTPGDWLRGQVHCRLRGLQKRRNGFRRAHHNSHAYIRHRFPDLEVADCERRAARLQAALGRSSRIRIDRWSKNIFVIEGS